MSALDVLAGLVLDDGRRWGEAAAEVPWQFDDARAVLEPGPDEPRLHWLARPKGGSKTTDVGGYSIAWLVDQAPPLAEGFAMASDSEQAGRLLNRARGFVARTPELAGRVRVEARRIAGPNGATVTALAADEAGAEGILSPWIMVDELPNWRDTTTARGMWTAGFSAVEKWPAARLVVIGHAGSPSHWSYRIMQRARVSSRWRVNEVPGPLPWMSAGGLEEQRALLLPSEFERRHLNRWCEAEDSLAALEDLEACAVLDGPQPFVVGPDYAVGVDLGHKRDRAVVVVAYMERQGGVWRGGEFVEQPPKVGMARKFMWRPSRRAPVDFAEVEEAVLRVHELYRRPSVRMDPWQGSFMGQRLASRGVRVIEATFSQAAIGKRAAMMFGLLRDRRLMLDASDGEMLDELGAVRVVERGPGLYRIDHDAGRHDDQVIALSLAVEQLLSEPQGYTGQIAVADERLKGRR